MIHFFGPKVAASFVILQSRDEQKSRNDKQQTGWWISRLATRPWCDPQPPQFTSFFSHACMRSWASPCAGLRCPVCFILFFVATRNKKKVDDALRSTQKNSVQVCTTHIPLPEQYFILHRFCFKNLIFVSPFLAGNCFCFFQMLRIDTTLQRNLLQQFTACIVSLTRANQPIISTNSCQTVQNISSYILQKLIDVRTIDNHLNL